MSKLIALVLVACLAGCGSVPKLQPPPPVCVKYETSEVLFNYSAAVVRDQTIHDLTKRIDRYLVAELQSDDVEISKECNPSVDAMLNVRIDSLEAIVSKKVVPLSFSAVIGHAELRYVATFVSADGKKLFVYDDERDSESLDDLAKKVASKLYRQVIKYY